MLGVNTIHELVAGQKSLNGPIFEILLSTQPLTARQIYFKLKKRQNLSMSYQAVHKRLQLLESEGMLAKDRREYSINSAWIERVDSFCSAIRDKINRRERELALLNQKKVILEQKNSLIKVVSVDLGGALFNNQFDELLWRTEIPRIYAEKYGLTKEDAFERVTSEYRRLWGKVDGWRDPEFWLKHFKLGIKFEDLIKPIQKEIVPYIDVAPVLRRLSKKYNLVVISHAQENVLMTKLKVGGCEKYFVKVYSIGSHFKKITKDSDIFQEICDDLKVLPEEIVHLGNSLDFDYKAPSSKGINAFLIDRIGHGKEPFVVRDLYEFEERIKEMEALEND